MFTGFFVISFWCYSTHSVIGIYCTLLPGVGQICIFSFFKKKKKFLDWVIVCIDDNSLTMIGFIDWLN